MPAQPSPASSKASCEVRQGLCARFPARVRGHLAVLGAAALGVLTAAPACIFVPPPLLPEEIAALEASKAARKAAAPAGPAVSPAGEGEGALGPEVTFKKGEEAPRGMNAAQLRAYNAAQGDPEASDFTLEEALAGLPGQGDELWAQLKTPRGVLECQLFAGKTPSTVANFVGLARGLRPFYDKASNSWVKRPYFDDTSFHRVIPGFMIQG
ncbi:MAG: peptidylprolyl isomerase, partial [Nannocystis sp.]